MSKIYFHEITDLNEIKKSINDIKLYFSNELVISGNFSMLHEAVSYTENLFKDKFLQDDKFIPGHHLCYIIDAKTKTSVGEVWYTDNFKSLTNETVARICYIRIYQECRNQGYGKAAIELLIKKLEPSGREKITLNVFKHNPTAIRLYEQLGFTVVKEVRGKCEMERLFTVTSNT